jgi:Fe-S-cluster containining protein
METDVGPPSICLGCGLCCDGTLLDHVAVSDPSDLGAPLASLGVTLIVQADPPVFALPCPAVHEGVCTVHHLHRPAACGEFSCTLLEDVEAGVLPRAEAKRIIAETLRLRDDVAVGVAPRSALEERLDRSFRR